jgi:hypothetical protein
MRNGVVMMLSTLAITACTARADSANSAAAGAAAPLIVRGAIQSVSATSLVIKNDTGSVTVEVSGPLHVYAREHARLADVTDNSFIGVTTVKQPNGAELATEIHIFPEELRGLGEGSRMMTESENGGGSRMTNGAVTAPRSRMSNGSVASENDSTLVVQYAGGSTTVRVPRDVAVTELKATSRALQAGDQVVALVTKQADGSLSASKVLLAGQ